MNIKIIHSLFLDSSIQAMICNFYLNKPKNWRYMIYGNFGEKLIHEPKDRIANHSSEVIFISSNNKIKNNSKETKLDIVE